MRKFQLQALLQWPCWMICFLLVLTAPVSAQLSSQGYSGFINVPSAFVTPRGWVEYQYNDQVDSRAPASIRTADNYIFSIGLTPRWEFGGRLLNQGGAGFGSNTNTFGPVGPHNRDLSAQTKFQLFSHRWLPAVAVGAQDFGGNQQRSSEYLVAGNRHRWLEYAVGYGTDRKEGVFWGLGLHAGNHASLLLDDDSKQRSAALRLSTGRLWRYQQLSAMWRFAAEGPQNDSFFGVTWSLSLGGHRWRAPEATGQPPGTIDFKADPRMPEVPPTAHKPAPGAILSSAAKTPAPADTQATTVGGGPQRETNDALVQAREVKQYAACADQLSSQLQQLGIERVWVDYQSQHQRLYLRYEGRSYPRSDVDALGVVLGTLTQVCPTKLQEYPIVLVQALQNGLVKFSLEAGSAGLYQYFQQDGVIPPAAAIQLGGRRKPAAGSALVPPRARDTWVEVSLDPVISYAVGTEFGVFDYSAGLETNIRVPLWAGAEVAARRRDEFDQSDDFATPRSRFFNSRIRDGWDSFLLQQVVSPLPGLFMAGYYGRTEFLGFDARTVGGEVAISPLPSGRLQWFSKYVDYEAGEPLFDNQVNPERRSFTHTLRGFDPNINTALDVTWGEYLFGDEGLRVILRRYFGDTHIGLVYKATRGREDEALGFSFSIPLTPTRSPRIGPVQFQGSPNWNSFIQTLINVDTNFLRPDLVQEVLPGNNLQTDWFDRGRLSPAYIQQSWPRMRDIWQRQHQG